MATVVAFHAHPDDEVLLTGGTLARLTAEGHRVVVVVACDGAMWPADGSARLDELRSSAALLGVARVEHLGYADSGYGPVLYADPPGRVRFARADAGEAAERLAAILRCEDADLLLSYDAAGGYGHRDHVKVHEVGALAARLASVRLLEGTVPRELAVLGILALGSLRLVVSHSVRDALSYGTPTARITHRVNVRRYAAIKRSALAAHLTPMRGKSRMSRLFRLAVALPTPLFAVLAGREWFTEPGAPPGPVLDDVLRSRVPVPERLRPTGTIGTMRRGHPRPWRRRQAPVTTSSTSGRLAR